MYQIIYGLILLITGVIVIKSSDAIGNLLIRIYILIRNFRLHIKSKYKDLDTINREINAEYSPAILSYIYNLKLEPKKDILATILNLYNKKIITIEKTNYEYKFIPNDNINLYSLSKDEKYIFNYLISNKKNTEKFSPKEWKKFVIEECDNNDFNKKIEFPDAPKFPLFSLILDIFITILFRGNIIALLFEDQTTGIVCADILLLILFAILNFILLWIIEGIIYDRISHIYQFLKGVTLNGKNEIIKWIKFKNFIKNYTLIKDRKIEEIVIYERYIPYAMVLGINKEYNNEKVKDFVENYMKFVDQNVTNYFYTDLSCL